MCKPASLLRACVLCAVIIALLLGSLLAPDGGIHAETPTPTLRIGESVTGTLTSQGPPDRFAVFGAYDELITIGMFADSESNLAPAFDVYAPDGTLLISASGPHDALVSAIRLPSTGAYIIYPKAGAKTAGKYSLSVGEGWILRDLDGGQVRVGISVHGTLARKADRQTWSLNVRSGAAFTILAQPAGTSQLDPVLEIISPSGKQVAVAHDFSPANSALTAQVIAPVAGTYLIRVSAYVNNSLGDYDLIVQTPAATPTPALRITAEPLNQRVEGSVGEGSRFSAIFNGIPGQIVKIDVRAKDPAKFDPVVELYGPSGRRVAEADDLGPGNTDARLQTTLDDGIGVYTVKVSGYALTPGEFKLIITSP